MKKENFIGILEHNLNYSHTFNMGINQFTDLTPDEFRHTYIGSRRYDVDTEQYKVGSYGCKTFSSNAVGNLSA